MCWDCWDDRPDPYKERNVYRPEDEDEMPHKKKGKSGSKKRFKGCPERNGSAHIYVWIEYHGKKLRWTKNGTKWVDTTWWDHVCVGCLHRRTRRYGYFNLDPAPVDIYEVRKVDHDWF
jgi:hypothetical protein